MERTKTRKIVLAAVLAALGMILGLLEIPYPFAPWLNLDLSEVVVLMAISMLGFKTALFVCVCKFFISITCTLNVAFASRSPIPVPPIIPSTTCIPVSLILTSKLSHLQQTL